MVDGSGKDGHIRRKVRIRARKVRIRTVIALVCLLRPQAYTIYGSSMMRVDMVVSICFLHVDVMWWPQLIVLGLFFFFYLMFVYILELLISIW